MKWFDWGVDEVAGAVESLERSDDCINLFSIFAGDNLRCGHRV